MEYPPVFEPGSYSLCGSPPDQPSAIYQSPSELKFGLSGGEMDSFSASHSNSTFSMSDSSFDTESGNSSSDVHHLEVTGRDVIAQRSQGGFTSSSTAHSLYQLSASSTRSPQNIYVSTPVASRSHQNLHVVTSGCSNSNQNLYVSSPTARPSSHQNIYVTSPVATSYHVNSSAAPTHATYSTTQIINVGNGSNSNVTGGNNSSLGMPTESSERHRSMNPYHVPEKKPVEDSQLSARSRPGVPPNPRQGSPRLHLPGPPESPPSDEETHISIPSQSESSI